MNKLANKTLKTRLTISAVLVAAFLTGCASKIDTVSEQNAINEFVAKAAVAEQLTGVDETSW